MTFAGVAEVLRFVRDTSVIGGAMAGAIGFFVYKNSQFDALRAEHDSIKQERDMQVAALKGQIDSAKESRDAAKERPTIAEATSYASFRAQIEAARKTFEEEKPRLQTEIASLRVQPDGAGRIAELEAEGAKLDGYAEAVKTLVIAEAEKANQSSWLGECRDPFFKWVDFKIDLFNLLLDKQEMVSPDLGDKECEDITPLEENVEKSPQE